MVSVFHLSLWKMLFSGSVDGFILFSTALEISTPDPSRHTPKKGLHFSSTLPFLFFCEQTQESDSYNIMDCMTSESCTHTHMLQIGMWSWALGFWWVTLSVGWLKEKTPSLTPDCESQEGRVDFRWSPGKVVAVGGGYPWGLSPHRIPCTTSGNAASSFGEVHSRTEEGLS